MNSDGSVRIIGGMFAFPEPLSQPHGTPAFLSDASILTVNGRSAIALVIDKVRPRRVWVPSYICAAVVDTVKTQAAIRFYAIDECLKSPDLRWVDGLGDGDLVIVADYFGFPFDPECARQARVQGARVVRDACQALLSSSDGTSADFVVYSPRKFVGVPDGGILTFAGWPGDRPRLQAAPEEWWTDALRASIARRDSDQSGTDRNWFALFQRVERAAPTGPFAMSSLSRDLLLRAFDYKSIAARRIANYRILVQELCDLAIFPQLGTGVVPLACPIRVRDRDRVRAVLIEQRIFPPVHWPVPNEVPELFSASYRLAGEIMSLPCDQRYDESDMRRIATLINSSRSR